MADRRDKILAGLDLAALTGVEIGPLNRPLVRRTDGRILYVDHADTPTLRRKYAADPSLSVEDIVDVDAIWGDVTLLGAVGRTVDYVVASHVIEHVPDLITWLTEVRNVLVPKGQLRLAVPDRRFTFDYRRAETRFSDVVHAWFEKARKPLPNSILDFILEVTEVDAGAAWRGRVANPQPKHDLQAALALAADARDNGAYHDVHCWVFTPIAFVRLMERLAGLGLAGFSCQAFFATEVDTVEFIVHAERCDDPALAAASWRAVLETIDSQGQRDQDVDVTALQATIASLRAQVDKMRNSPVWRTAEVLRPTAHRLLRVWRWCGRVLPHLPRPAR